ncbi:MAG TPA: hypothetical protein VK787_16230 [Puia sp.]|jgi:hypothetical protein|nr:hypothetical protein [Puia sp.]
MEVHHHPNVEKKNFRQYFLEFLMIFLAVSMGFFAESIRDHFAEKKISRQYLETFRQELINNKNTFRFADSVYNTIIPAQDSVIKIFFNKKENENLITVARLLKRVKRTVNPIIDKAAYQQMVNSGGLKNIDNIKLRDSLSEYVGRIDGFEVYNSISYNRLANALPELMKLEDVHDFSPQIQDQNIIPVISPYPELTERERRLIIYYYTNFTIQFKADKRLIHRLDESNTHIMDMVEDELKK